MNGQVVHVVDDDADMRSALALLLSSEGFAVRVHDSAVAFVDALPRIEGGCVVTDIRMPGMSGLELQERLADLKPRLPVIVLTAHAEVPLAVLAMKAGAVDFVEKPFDDEVLLSAIRLALAQSASLSQEAERAAAVRNRFAVLSERELSVLQGLTAGKTNKGIARDLGISVRTVEVHRANVMTKMQAGSLPELVRMALLAERGGA